MNPVPPADASAIPALLQHPNATPGTEYNGSGGVSEGREDARTSRMASRNHLGENKIFEFWKIFAAKKVHNLPPPLPHPSTP